MPRSIRVSSVIATALAAGIVAGSAGAVLVDRASSDGSSGKPATAHLVIRHVQRGCHVWSTGSLKTPSLRLNVAAGGRLHVVNRDVVPHELVELAGPNLALSGHIMPGRSRLITFSLPGVYRLKTKVVKMGPEPKVETIGGDNTLRLTVTVP